jgi:hypothetical protein
MTDDVDDTELRIAALQLLLAALSPDADDTKEFTRTILNMLEPVRAQDGRVYVDVDRLRFVLQGAVANAKPPAASSLTLELAERKLGEDVKRSP